MCVGYKYMVHTYSGLKYFGLEVKEQVGRVGSCDVGNYPPICPLATSSVKIKSKFGHFFIRQNQTPILTFILLVDRLDLTGWPPKFF